jgi:hypothetical protein
VWRAIEVEGYTQQANRIFPFSKPSPFSSMTDWPLDSQQTMTNALHRTITKKLKNHDTRKNPAPRSQQRNDQIQKNNGRTPPPQKHLKRPEKLQKNDQTQKIRLNTLLELKQPQFKPSLTLISF